MNTHRFMALLTALALVTAACGDTTPTTDDSTTTTTPTVTTTTSNPTTTTTAEPTTTRAAEQQTVLVYFSVDGADCGAVDAFERTGPAGSEPVELALTELLGGPTAGEQGEGAGSFFSSETADTLQAIDLTDGLLTVEFSDIRFLNNASTSCGSQALLSSLSSTALQFDAVERVRFTIWGSCSLFWNWLQSECSDVTRDGTIPAPVDVNSLASGSGCTPGTGDLPDGTWFGYVTGPSLEQLEFDLACWFSGAGAIEATLEDGEESPPPNDYYIRNTSTDTRTLGVADDVAVEWLPPEDIATLTPIEYDEWIRLREETEAERGWLPGVWIEIADGEVISIEEQYQP